MKTTSPRPYTALPLNSHPSPPAESGAALERSRDRPAGITILVVLAVFYTLYVAGVFLLPITCALLLAFLLSPAVRALTRVRVTSPFAAGLVILAVFGTGGIGVYALSGPVQRWTANAPETLATAEGRLRRILKPIERVSAQVQSAASGAAGSGQPVEAVAPRSDVVSQLFGSTRRFLAGALEAVILLFFLLSAGDLFLDKLIKGLPNVRDKRKAFEIARETEAAISTYLLTAAAVNVVEGAAVSGAMYLLGMPNAPLWGALVALLEFIPYLGALTMVGILSVAALATFPDVGHALLVPGTFLVINLIQVNLVTPQLLGHRLALNPVALFVSLAFWFWIWGIPGAFIAVPLLATFKIFCDHIDALAGVGAFLGGLDDGEQSLAR
jgi:predicted PurR-regulated permease PerM